VIGNPVEHDANAEFVSLPHEGVEVLKSPEDRIDTDVVGNVVAEVTHGREEDRREPQCVDAEPRKVRELTAYAAQIANTVVVRVAK